MAACLWPWGKNAAINFYRLLEVVIIATLAEYGPYPYFDKEDSL